LDPVLKKIVRFGGLDHPDDDGQEKEE